jgi:hypothetical protein
MRRDQHTARFLRLCDRGKSMVLFASCGIPISNEQRSSGKRDQGFESRLLQRGVCELSVAEPPGCYVCEPEAGAVDMSGERKQYSRNAHDDLRPVFPHTGPTTKEAAPGVIKGRESASRRSGYYFRMASGCKLN